MPILDSIVIDKNDLLSKVEENRNLHAKIWEESKEGYLKKCKEELAKKSKEFESISFDKASLNLNVSKPTNHLDDYDIAVQMLKWSSDDKLTLTPIQFENYVLDKWSWSVEWYGAASGCASTTAINVMNNV